MVNFEPK